MILPAHADVYHVTLKDKDGIRLEFMPTTTDNKPVNYGELNKINYVKSCTIEDSIPIIAQDHVTVGSYVELSEQSPDSIRLRYTQSQLVELKEVEKDDCKTHIPQVSVVENNQKVMIKPGQTVNIELKQGVKAIIKRATTSLM